MEVILLRIVSFLAGAALLYLALLLYEDEEGTLQNKLEEFWLYLQRLREESVQRHESILQSLAAFISDVLDTLFGTKLFSWHAAAVSMHLSFASWFLLNLFMDGLGGIIWRVWLMYCGCQMAAVTFLAHFGSDRSRYRAYFRVSTFQILFPILVLSMIAPFAAIKTAGNYMIPLLFSLFVLLSFAFDVFFIAVTRIVLRRVASFRSPIAIVSVVSVNAAMITLLAVAPWFAVAYLKQSKHEHFLQTYVPAYDWVLQGSSLSNGPSVAAATCFLVLVLALMIHSTLWPNLSRVIYSLQRYEIVRKKKLLGALGCVFVTAAIPHAGSWLQAMAGKLRLL
jgi:hypothetical protein